MSELLMPPCVRHPKNIPMLLVRRAHVDVCYGQRGAALLLAVFEYWHNVKTDLIEAAGEGEEADYMVEDKGRRFDARLLQFYTEEELEERVFGIRKRKVLRKGIEALERWGYITVTKNPNPRYKMDRTRYFLLHPEKVQARIDEVYPDGVAPRRGRRKAAAPAENF